MSLFDDLKVRILKSIITLSEIGQHTGQANKVANKVVEIHQQQ